eukprot:4384465-Prorocentrum_lima.AAC.1
MSCSQQSAFGSILLKTAVSDATGATIWWQLPFYIYLGWLLPSGSIVVLVKSSLPGLGRARPGGSPAMAQGVSLKSIALVPSEADINGGVSSPRRHLKGIGGSATARAVRLRISWA